MSNPFEFRPAGDAEAFRNAHKSSDTDAESLSMHHTLGRGSTQAAPGNHDHDGDYSDPLHNHDLDYADISHTHAIADVTDLQTELDDKSDIAHTHSYTPYFEEAYCSTGTVIANTTDTDVTGMSITVPVAATTDVFEVIVVLDVSQTTAAASGILLGNLNVDGVLNPDGITFRGAGSNDRGTVVQTWKITGLAAGNRVFKVQARLNAGTTPSYTVSQPRSHMTIKRVSPVA